MAIFLMAPTGPATAILPSFFLDAFQGALASDTLPILSELFPTDVRASGQGFCLGGGCGFGSVVPATVGIIAATCPLGTAMGACAQVSDAVAFCAAITLPEPTGVDLKSASSK